MNTYGFYIKVTHGIIGIFIFSIIRRLPSNSFFRLLHWTSNSSVRTVSLIIHESILLILLNLVLIFFDWTIAKNSFEKCWYNVLSNSINWFYTKVTSILVITLKRFTFISFYTTQFKNVNYIHYQNHISTQNSQGKRNIDDTLF